MIIDPHWIPILYAILLLLAAIALLILEFFIVSLGLLSIGSLACALAAIYFAFKLGPVVGYSFIAVATLFAIIIIRWGIRRVQTSSAVPKTAITGDAGYHHVAKRLGITIGAVGTLVTPARPTGRARFASGECDVQTRNQSLERGTDVIVDKIDGAIIHVTANHLD